ncbi:MAG: TolC family protein [Pyrinomonadaceae bacterium]|nr:TolC family protein [Pyrinomonadaceae bacterium]
MIRTLLIILMFVFMLKSFSAEKTAAQVADKTIERSDEPNRTASNTQAALDEKRNEAVESVPTTLNNDGNRIADGEKTVTANDADKAVEKLPPPPNVANRIGVDVNRPVALTVTDVIRLALENNNDIRVAETDVKIAEFNLRSSRGVFDPVLQSENFYERSVTPAASSIGGGADGKLKQTNFANNFTFRGSLPKFGGNYQLDFNNSRQTSNQLFNTLNPQYTTSLNFTFTQPLWRGLKTDDNRRRIEIAKKNISLSDAQFRQRTIEIIEQVESAYWDLTFSLKNLQVQSDAVKQAVAQLESTRRQVEQGVLAPIEIVQSETQVANFKQNLFTAQEQVANAENNLKRISLPNRNHPYWSQPVIPASDISLEVPRISLPEATRVALENRPEIALAETNREINQINNRFLRDQTKPRIDLIATYRADGLSGTVVNNNAFAGFSGSDPELRDRVDELSNIVGLPPLPVAPPSPLNNVPNNLRGGYGRSLSNLLAQNYPTYQIGIRVEIPVGNKTAKAELGRSLAEQTRLGYERQQTEQNIEAEVRNSLQAVASAEERSKAATDARVAAEKQYEGERRQFAAGTSTVFLVLERQVTLVNAQGREIETLTNLNKVIANLRRVTGGTLERVGISLRIAIPRYEIPNGK